MSNTQPEPTPERRGFSPAALLSLTLWLHRQRAAELTALVSLLAERIELQGLTLGELADAIDETQGLGDTPQPLVPPIIEPSRQSAIALQALDDVERLQSYLLKLDPDNWPHAIDPAADIARAPVDVAMTLIAEVYGTEYEQGQGQQRALPLDPDDEPETELDRAIALEEKQARARRRPAPQPRSKPAKKAAKTNGTRRPKPKVLDRARRGGMPSDDTLKVVRKALGKAARRTMDLRTDPGIVAARINAGQLKDALAWLKRAGQVKVTGSRNTATYELRKDH
jgi:hypothetical protein